MKKRGPDDMATCQNLINKMKRVIWNNVYEHFNNNVLKQVHFTQMLKNPIDKNTSLIKNLWAWYIRIYLFKSLHGAFIKTIQQNLTS